MANSSDKQSRISEYNSYASYGVSIRKEVCRLLDENPLLTAKMLAKLMNLEYKKYRQTLTNYRNFWVYNHENERGSKCSSLHCFKAKVKLDLPLSQGLRGVVDSEVEKRRVWLGFE